MSIGYVLDRFPSIHQTFVLNEMLALEDLGADLVVFSLLPPAPLTHEGVARLRASVHYAPPIRRLAPNLAACARALAAGPDAWLWTVRLGLVARDRLVLASWLRGAALSSTARTLGVRHVHAHFASGANVVAMVMARLLRVPYSFTTHAVDLYARSVLLCDTLAEARFAVTSTDYNGRFIAERCGASLAGKVALVRACVDPARFLIGERAAHDPPVILSVGRLIEKKGHRDLIAAAALLRDRGVRFALWIVGDGPQRAALTEQVARCGLGERVDLRSPISQDELRDLYGHVDVVALPCVVAADGDRDGIPVTLIEALAAGLPVVSTEISGIPELVTADVGVLVPPHAPMALADALARLLGDPALRQRLGAAGPSRVREAFNVRKSAAQMLRLFAGESPAAIEGA